MEAKPVSGTELLNQTYLTSDNFVADVIVSVVVYATTEIV